MRLTLNGKLSGTVNVPPSKSIAHRLLICASLADEMSHFKCGEYADDVEVTADCLRSLGATVKYSDNEFRIWPIERPEKRCTFDCRESGSTLRFMLPIAAALGVEATFTGDGRLAQRPLSPLYEEMVRHGVQMTPHGVIPLSCSGQLTGGEYRIAGNVSSQFISGLLFALPLVEEDSTIEVTGPLQSTPYIDMTLNALLHAGISIDRQSDLFHIPGRQRYSAISPCRIEGDWSAAAFWLTAGCIGSESIVCSGLNTECSLQGDRAIVEILRDMGAAIRCNGESAVAYPSRLHGTDIDCSDIPDLVPALAAAAACAEGRTRFFNAERLRLKESDRIETVISMLGAFGITASFEDNVLTVNGARPEPQQTVKTSSDHRIAMAAAVLSSVCDSETVIDDAECVSKSYPDFFNDYRALGGHLS